MRDITRITYNISNLPEQMVKVGGSIVNYWYDVNGNRIRKEEAAESLDDVYVLGINGETEAVFDANGTAKFFNVNAGNEIISKFIPGADVDLLLTNTILSGDYQAINSITAETNVVVNGTATLTAGTVIYLKPGFTANSGCNFIAKIGTVTDETARFYYVKDHLGSIRVTVDEVGDIAGYDDYDPWGIILAGRSSLSIDDARYKFTSKERDVETGYDYFGARYYDSRIGRWLTVDPLANKYPGWSPYNYTFNNPLRFIDTDGEVVSDPITLSAAAATAIAIGVGITIYATYKVTEQYLANGVLDITNFGMDVQNLSLGLMLTVGQGMTNLFSSDETQKQVKESENVKGSKSKEEYDEHQREFKEGKTKIKKLEEKLSKTKGPKKQKPIKEQIKRAKEKSKGHEKEIKEKWDKGRPQK